LDLGPEPMHVHPNYVWGLNFTVRKSTFIELGGFHPDNIPKRLQHFQGDGDTGLTIKASEEGLKALYHPDIALLHKISAPRLTLEYFDERAYYQGVGNSFTYLRGQFGLYKTQKENSVIDRIKRIVYNGYKKITISGPEKRIKNRISSKLDEGFKFHQKAFKESTVVKNWVLKENYFNYNLPVND
jgi:hypothetical protein